MLEFNFKMESADFQALAKVADHVASGIVESDIEETKNQRISIENQDTKEKIKIFIQTLQETLSPLMPLVKGLLEKQFGFIPRVKLDAIAEKIAQTEMRSQEMDKDIKGIMEIFADMLNGKEPGEQEKQKIIALIRKYGGKAGISVKAPETGTNTEGGEHQTPDNETNNEK